MDEKKKPAIRFRGFTEDWEQHKLGELCNVYDGTHQTPEYKESGIMFLSVENIKTLKSQKYISKEDFEKDFSVFPEIGDVLMTRIGDIGTTNVVQSNEPKAYYVSLALLKKKILDPYFLKESIYSKTVKKEIWQRTLHIAFPKKINKNEITQVTIPYPLNKDEQKAIGRLFYNLDQLITFYQCKYDKIQNVKKSMLEKMFPQSGKNVPEIRFKGFTDNWEQWKFSELGSVAMNKRIFKEQTSEKGEVPFYKIGTFGGQPDAYISRKLYEEYKAKYSYPKVGDILISASGSIGKMVEYIGKDEYFQDSNIIWFNHDERINNAFLKCFYFIVKWAGIEGSTIKRLYNDNILNTMICLPSIIEQEKIGDFFKYFDHLINLQQRKIEKLQNIKKFCIEKMFI